MKKIQILKKSLFWFSLVCFLASTPCMFFGLLGLLGVVADVGDAENRKIGLGFLGYSLIPLGIGVVALCVSLAIRKPDAK